MSNIKNQSETFPWISFTLLCDSAKAKIGSKASQYRIILTEQTRSHLNLQKTEDDAFFIWATASSLVHQFKVEEFITQSEEGIIPPTQKNWLMCASYACHKSAANTDASFCQSTSLLITCYVTSHFPLLVLDLTGTKMTTCNCRTENMWQRSEEKHPRNRIHFGRSFLQHV